MATINWETMPMNQHKIYGNYLVSKNMYIKLSKKIDGCYKS